MKFALAFFFPLQVIIVTYLRLERGAYVETQRNLLGAVLES